MRVHRGDHATDSAKLASKQKQMKSHSKRALVTSGDAHRLANQANELADHLQAQQAVLRQQQVELAIQATLAAGQSSRPDPTDSIDRLLGDATLATGTTAAAVYLLDDETEFLATRFVFGLSPAERLGSQRPLRGARGDLEAMVKGLVAIDDMDLGPISTWRSPEPFPSGICVCLGEAEMPIGTMWLYAAAVTAFNDVHTAAARLAASNLQQTLLRLAEQEAAPDSSIRLILPSDVTLDHSRDVSPPPNETHDDMEMIWENNPTSNAAAPVEENSDGVVPPDTIAPPAGLIGCPPADESASVIGPIAEDSSDEVPRKVPSRDHLDLIDDESLLDAALESAIEAQLVKSDELIADLQRDSDFHAEPEFGLYAEEEDDDAIDDAPVPAQDADAEQWPLLSGYDEETMRLAAKLDIQDAQFLAGEYDPTEIDQFDADALEFHHGWDNEELDRNVVDDEESMCSDFVDTSDDEEEDDDGNIVSFDLSPDSKPTRESETIEAINDIIALIDDFDADFPTRAPEHDKGDDSILTNQAIAEEIESENSDLAQQVSIWQHQTLPMGTKICPSWYADGMIESPLDVAQSWHHWDILPDGQIAIAICQPNGGATAKIDLSNVMDVTVIRAALQAHMGYRHQPADAVRRAYDTLFQIRDHSFAGEGHGNVSLLYAHIDPETGETRMASTGDWSTLAISKFGYRPVGWLDRESDRNHRDLGTSDPETTCLGNVDITSSHLHLQQGEVFLVAGCQWMGLQPATGVPGYPQHQIGTAITQAMREGKVSPLAALRTWMAQTTLNGERSAMALHRMG
ncbi:Serine phosphatase RsbU, regulator of sigma subunit [Rhodopirellula islandica]|uniref:Serine phosphatase RsbU, regulator of sigma subunit n=2 Tax=Rhodopirellula islandica TaxID=595434 RepID=A0A0J1BFB5_RHOIS|nr:Serine phosphatase RsbU, regulator of sigma subunit [Rhodopirellula islandica]